jgi:DNA invertase Pin-like site-specific DNA recombinase
MNPHPPLARPKKPCRRVAIYTRARDDEGLRRQRKDVERHVAEQPEWAIAAVYEDVARADKKRPALDRLLADARNGAFDLLFVRDMPRLGRSMQDFARTVRTLDACRVVIATTAERVNTGTPEGRLVMSEVTAFVDGFTVSRHDPERLR